MKNFSKVKIFQFIFTQNLQFIFLPKDNQHNQKQKINYWFILNILIHIQIPIPYITGSRPNIIQYHKEQNNKKSWLLICYFVNFIVHVNWTFK
jgi:hypothetical protein